jgi:uncharacterized phage protein gp47/JayE
MAGVDSNGFTLKTYNEIIADMEARAKNEYGLDIDLSDSSPLSKFLRDIAQELASFWQIMEDVYYSGYLDTATGVNLDRVVALIGLTRKQATKATGTVTFSRSTPASSDILIPAGTRVSTAGDNPVYFKTTDPVTLTAGSTSVDAPIEAVEAGAAGNVAANTITVIVDPVSGIESVNNASATSGGQDTESDAAFRTRVKQSLSISGNATLDAIRAEVLKVNGVTACSIEENDTTQDNTGTGGLPPKSFRVTVLGGDDNDIAQAIFDSKPAGIQAYGSVSGIAVADDGAQYTINFERPEQVTIYVDVQVTKDSTYPADGDTQVQTAVIDYIGGVDANGDTHIGLGIGEDVIYAKVVAAVMSIQGVVDATVKIDTTSPPAGTSNISIGATQVARASTTSVTVTSA